MSLLDFDKTPAPEPSGNGGYVVITIIAVLVVGALVGACVWLLWGQGL